MNNASEINPISEMNPGSEKTRECRDETGFRDEQGKNGDSPRYFYFKARIEKEDQTREYHKTGNPSVTWSVDPFDDRLVCCSEVTTRQSSTFGLP